MRVEGLYIAGTGLDLPEPMDVAQAQEAGLCDERTVRRMKMRSVCVSVDSGPEMAARAARRAIDRSGTAPQDISPVQYAGCPPRTEHQRRDQRDQPERDDEAMIAAVSDRMLAEMAVCGTAEEVRETLPAIEKRYDHAALYSPSFTLSPERVAENTEAIIEMFAAR